MSYITTNISPSQGFHPISTNVVHFSATNSSSSLTQCSLHLYFKLPPLLFVDPHELAQRNNTYTFHHWGSRDLERPVHALREADRGGSEVLLYVRLAASSIDDDRKRPEPSANAVSQTWNVTVELPMHLRYGVPAPASSTSGSEKPYEHVHVDTPIAFLLCKTSPKLVDNATQLPASLPSHVTAYLPKSPPNILIPIPTHLEVFPDSSCTNVITVPLGSISDLLLVELGTSLTIIVCFFWLAIVSWKTLLRLTRVPCNSKLE